MLAKQNGVKIEVDLIGTNVWLWCWFWFWFVRGLRNLVFVGLNFLLDLLSLSSSSSAAKMSAMFLKLLVVRERGAGR